VDIVQVISILGAITILVAYGANQAGYIGTERLSYSVMNLVGSGILATVSVIEEQWGFLLLEGVWAVVSVWALWRHLDDRRSTN
jgi:hypothetical protein